MNPLRRKLLGAVAGAVGTSAMPAWPQPTSQIGAGRTPTVFQIVDMSAAQVDVSKDFLVGSRAAWQEINTRGAGKGRLISHQTIEVDGSTASIRTALETVKQHANVVALIGSVGDRVASQLSNILRKEIPDIAHVAPWLQNPKSDLEDNTFAIFATRSEQIAHAVKSLSVMSVTDVGAVYASLAEFASYKDDVNASCAALGLRVQTFGPIDDLSQLGRSLTANSPRILIFLGGSPELLQFSQGMDKQGMQRFIIAMSDVNLQVLQQMGLSKHAHVVATQVVPMVNSSLPLVRSFRETLGRLYDEPPTPLSLSGYTAVRYAYEVFRGIDGPLTRASSLLAFQRRAPLDLGGLRIDPGLRRTGSAFVTQGTISSDGRIVG